MDTTWLQPAHLFPWLALAFVLLALVRRRGPAARTWWLLALAFGAVAAWLRWGS